MYFDQHAGISKAQENYFPLLFQHNLWRRKKRQAGEDIRFVKKIVFYNESVNYTDSTIRITDTDGTVTGL